VAPGGIVKLALQILLPGGSTHAVERLVLRVEEQDGGRQGVGWTECLKGRLGCRDEVDGPDRWKIDKFLPIFFSIYG
jgi:hypothetical protein